MSNVVESPSSLMAQANNNMALQKNSAALMSQISDIVEKTNDEAKCTDSLLSNDSGVCTDEQWLSILDARLIDAKKKTQDAPNEYIKAEKDYYSLKDKMYGTNKLSNLQKAQATKIAQAKTKIYDDSFLEKYKIAVASITDSKLAVDGSKNVKEGFTNEVANLYNDQFYDIYKNLNQYYNDYYSIVNTNNRKTYYESQALNSIEKWNKILFWLYYVVLSIWVLCILFVGRTVNLFIFSELILLSLYPFFIDYITHNVYDIVQQLYDMLPSNVYNNM